MNPTSKPVTNDWDFKYLLQVAFSYRRLIAFVAFLALLTALAYCLRAKPLYQSVTTVRIPHSSNTTSTPLDGSYTLGGDQIETDIEICQSENVATRVIQAMALDKKPGFQGATPTAMAQRLLGMVSVSNVLKSDLLTIRAEAPDPQFAADLANAWAQGFIESELDMAHQAAAARVEFLEGEARKMKEKLSDPAFRISDESKAYEDIYQKLLDNLGGTRLAENNQNLGVVVVDRALPPDSPVKPRKRKIMELALLLGLFLGFQCALLVDRLTDRVRGLDKLNRASGLPNCALLPDFHLGLSAPGGVKGLIQEPVFQDSEYLEGFRILRANLHYARTGKPLEAVCVLAPGRGQGASLVNANLALSMALVGKKVLLVDADLRQPSLGALFGVESKEGMGLQAALGGRGTWKSMVVASGTANLDLLPNATAAPNATELLSGEAMRRFVEEARKSYDFVVFDGAPVLGLTDSLVLATLMDGVVLLARWGMTRSGEVAKSVEELATVQAKLLGTVLNAVGAEKGILRLVQPNLQGEWSAAVSWEKGTSPSQKGTALAQRFWGFFKWLVP